MTGTTGTKNRSGKVPVVRILLPILHAWRTRAAEKRPKAVILSSSEGSAFEFSSQCRFFLRFAQDRLLAPQNDSVHEFFRSLNSPLIVAVLRNTK